MKAMACAVLILGSCRAQDGVWLTHLHSSANLSFGSIMPSACVDRTLSLAGAETGDSVVSVWPNGLNRRLYNASSMFVSKPGFIAVRLCNPTRKAATVRNYRYEAIVVRELKEDLF